MHSTSMGPSNGERSSGLPCMWRWLSGIWRLQVVVLPVLFTVGEQRGRPEQ